MTTSFENLKELEFVLSLNGDESDGPLQVKPANYDKVIYKGVRASVSISNAGQGQFTEMNCKIWGMKEDTMFQFTTLKLVSNLTNANSIVIYAVDGPNKTLVFAGNMIRALCDYNALPNASLTIMAQIDYSKVVNPAIARSFKGEVDANSIFAQLASEMGKAFENNSVSVKVRDISLRGSIPDMIRDLAKMTGVQYVFEGGNLAIWNTGSPRRNFSHQLSPNSGLIGYPTFDGSRLHAKVMFNQNIVIGSVIEIKDTKTFGANGKFYVHKITHMLESNMPNGAWFSNIEAMTEEYYLK
jgi:hypothetical protein